MQAPFTLEYLLLSFALCEETAARAVNSNEQLELEYNRLFS